MSNINKNNYEAFLLDYMEQNLAPDMVAELMLFLEQNPELKAELEDMEELAVIEASTIEFPNKAELKKEGLENLMIAEVEGLNSPAESKELQKIVSQDEEAEKAFVLFQKTKLAAEPVVYADKADLKRKEGKVIPLYWWVSSAAAILIMVFLFRGLNNTNNIEATEFANTEKQEVGSQKVEDGGRKTEAGSRESEDGSQELEGGGWEAEVGGSELEGASQELVASNQELEVGSQKTEDGSRESEDGGWKTEVGGSELVASNQQQETTNPTLDTEHSIPVEKDSILIAPMEEEEVLYAENETPVTTKKSLTIPQFLKKEVNQRILNDDNPQKNKPAEVVVADILAKAAGRKGSVDKTKNEEGEVEEYALNIGGFSFSRKVRK